MYKAKTLSSNASGYAEAHSKTARGSSSRNNRSSISKNSSSNASLSFRHESSDELISQVEREITKWRDLRSSKMPNEGLKKRENDLKKIVSSRTNDSNTSEKSARLPLQMNSALDLKNLSGHISELIPDSAKNNSKSGRSPLNRNDLENSLNKDFKLSDISPKVNSKRKESGIDQKNFSSSVELSKMNGIILDPRMLFSGNPYNIISEKNGIKSQSKDLELRKIPVFDLLSLYGPKNMSDSFEAKEYDSNNRNGLDNPNQAQQEFGQEDDVKFDDLNAFLQDQSITPDEADEFKNVGDKKMDKEFMINYKHYNKKSINKNIDDYNATYNEGNSQNGNTFKKHLSIIFSTGKSMEVSIDSRYSEENQEPKNIIALNTEEENPIIRQKEEAAAVIMKADLLFNAESPETEEKQSPSVRDIRPESEVKDVCTKNSSLVKNNDEEIVYNVIQTLKLQSKENKPLEETVTKLMEVYSKRIEKYEDKLKRVSEKCERYKLANQKLGQIIKNWEQEIDQLAMTNKKLHDIAVGLESELEDSRSKEKKFQTLYREQKLKTSKATEQNKKYQVEIEAIKKELLMKEEKNKSLTTYTQKSDELVQTISSSIRTLIVEKSANKISSENLFKFLEGIESEASKLIEELEIISGRKLHLTSPREIASLKHKLSINTSLIDEIESTNNHLNTIIPPSLASPANKDVKKYESVPCVTSKTKSPERISLSIKTPQKRNSLAHSIELLMINPQSPQVSSKRLASPTSYKTPATTKNSTSNSKTPVLPNQMLKKTLMRRLAGSESKKHWNWSLTQSINDDGTKTTEREDSSSYSMRNKSRDKNFANISDRVSTKKK